MKTNAQQRAAITQLKRALTACKKTNVKLFAMDDTLYATVKHDPGKDFHQQYQEANGGDSDLIEQVVAGGVYVGSGGW